MTPPTEDEYDEQTTDNARIIRKRSSKACDNCRKAKCKCERSASQDANAPCRNCVLLGAECTFLGPSRKRGPPKGYIDAIESKLHQMEALLGTIITSTDDRAKSLMADLLQDELARDIIVRVNDTPFGERGRRQAAASREQFGFSPPFSSSHSKRRESRINGLLGSTSPGAGIESEFPTTVSRFGFVGPPHEWQDKLTSLINSRAGASYATSSSAGTPDINLSVFSSSSSSRSASVFAPHTHGASGIGSHRQDDVKPFHHSQHEPQFPSYSFDATNPHQRRRIDPPASPPLNLITDSFSLPPTTSASPSRAFSSQRPPYLSSSRSHTPPPLRSYPRGHPHSPESEDAAGAESDYSDASSADIMDAVGQLSINDKKQVRYHGKSSGLHLLMPAIVKHQASAAPCSDSPYQPQMPLAFSQLQNAADLPIQDGVWNFAEEKFLDALSQSSQATSCDIEVEAAKFLPDVETQVRYLELYFRYVNPSIPFLNKRAVMRDWEIGLNPSHSMYAEAKSRLPSVLLLAMFSVSARYSNDFPSPASPGDTWTAGDVYHQTVHKLVTQNYNQLTRIVHVQIMLLIGYREAGIGAMAMAWLCVGTAIRTAQEIGLHRNIDKWDRDFVQKQFGTPERYEEEKITRGRIWYCCCRMDLFLSAYIGRPLTIHEKDYDTPFPEGDEDEEMELWVEHPSAPPGGGDPVKPKSVYTPQISRVTSCHRAAHSIGRLGAAVLDNLYSIKPKSIPVQHLVRERLSRKLDKWYNDLEEGLRFDNPSARTYCRTPNVVELHVQYWCTVLLLHRPFIKMKEGKGAPIITDSSLGKTSEQQQKRGQAQTSGRDDAAVAAKAYNMCTTAAQHITNLAAAFSDSFNMQRASPTFSYAVFSAAIMHVTSLLDNPQDVQAQLGLQKTMLFLKNLSVVWPCAARAWELLDASKLDVRQGVELERLTNAFSYKSAKKRVTVDDLDPERVQQMTGRGDWSPTAAISSSTGRGGGYFGSQVASNVSSAEQARRRSTAGGIQFHHLQHQRISSPPVIVPSQSPTGYQGMMGSGGRLIDSASPVHDAASGSVGFGRSSTTGSNAPSTTGSSRDADQINTFGTSSGSSFTSTRPQWPPSHNLPPLADSSMSPSLPNQYQHHQSSSLPSLSQQQLQQLPPLLMSQDPSPHNQPPAPLSPLSQILQQASPHNYASQGYGHSHTPPISATSQGPAGSRFAGSQYHLPDPMRDQSVVAPTPLRQHTLESAFGSDGQSSRYSEAPSTGSGSAWSDYPHPPPSQQSAPGDAQYSSAISAPFGSSSGADVNHMLPPMSMGPHPGYQQQHSGSGGFEQQYNQYRGGAGSFFGGEQFMMRAHANVIAGG